MRAATRDIKLGRESAVERSASLSGYAADRNDFLACVGASDSRVLFANIVRNIEKRDNTLLFVFNRYYDDSRRIDSSL